MELSSTCAKMAQPISIKLVCGRERAVLKERGRQGGGESGMIRGSAGMNNRRPGHTLV